MASSFLGALKPGDVEKTKELLKGIQDINCPGGETLLHIACSSGDIRMIRILCDHGVDVNARDNDGNPPLILSVKKQTYKVAVANTD